MMKLTAIRRERGFVLFTATVSILVLLVAGELASVARARIISWRQVIAARLGVARGAAAGPLTLPRLWLVAAVAATATAQPANFPLLKDCSRPDQVLAWIQTTDHVEVRYALAGNRETCYAVRTTVDGDRVEGFVIGAAHPDLAAFAREVRSQIPEIPQPVAPPPAPPAAAAAEELARAPETPESFAGLSGLSPKGRRVSLDALAAPTVVLYFWSANDRKSIREAEAMDAIFETYQGKGVGLVGVVSGGAAQARTAMNENEVVWPQILDHGEIAARYPQTKETRYFILDRGRNVVAALQSAEQVQRELLKLRTRRSSE